MDRSATKRRPDENRGGRTGLPARWVTALGLVMLAGPAFAGGERCHRASRPDPEPLEVAVLLYDGAELLDFTGPAAVFGAAGHLAAARGLRPLRVTFLGDDSGPLTAVHGPEIRPDAVVDPARPPDVLVVPGGATRLLEESPEFLELMRATAADGLVLTVCGAALVAADLGLLDGRPATTHAGSLRQLARRESVEVHGGVRFVDAGSVVTAGGPSAGIDGALHVLGRLYDAALAERVAAYLQHPWPPAVAGHRIVESDGVDPDDRATHLFEGAIGQVRDGDYDVALRWLRASFEAGYPSPADVFEVAELRRLAAMPEYGREVERLVEEFLAP